jgi:histidinol dehydrogenase
MTMIYLKKATRTPSPGKPDVRAAVEAHAGRASKRDGDAAAIRFAREMDKWHGEIIVTREAIDAATAAQVPEKLKNDIRFAHRNIRASPKPSAPPSPIARSRSSRAFSPGRNRSPSPLPAATSRAGATATSPAPS